MRKSGSQLLILIDSTPCVNMSELAGSRSEGTLKRRTADFSDESLPNPSMDGVIDKDDDGGFIDPKRRKIDPSGTVMSRHALTVDLIVEIVMKNLTLRDLLQCRLVNKALNRVATRLVKALPNAFMTVNSDSDFDSMSARISDVGCENFPFRALEVNVSKTDFDNDPEEWKELKFFQVYATFVSRLKLKAEHRNALKAPLVTSLLATFANISTFYFPRMNLSYKKTEVLLDQNNFRLVLTRLSTIELPRDPRKVNRYYFGNLLQSCPNLTEIRSMHNSLLPEVIEAAKLRTVKSLTYCGCNLPRNPSQLQVLPVLTSLEVVDANRTPDGEAGCQSCEKLLDLVSLLTLNQHNLRHLALGWPLNYQEPLPDWTQFKFTNLKSLQVSYDHLFPKKCASSFPVLETIRMPIYEDAYTLTDCLWTDITPTVHTLDVDLWLTTYEMELFAETFPNVKYVRVNAKSCMDEDGDGSDYWQIWSVGVFDHLEKVEVRNWEIKKDMKSTSFNLDSFLTELPPSVIAKLKHPDKSKIKAPKFDGSERNLSTLSQLKEFSMSFLADEKLTPEDIKNNVDYCVISEVSYKYAISKIPGLKVKFYYDFRCEAAKAIEEALKPAASFVNFFHRDAESFGLKDYDKLKLVFQQRAQGACPAV